MNSDDVPSGNPDDDASADELHQGYDLETGLLARAHEWIDLLPPLRLLRTLRVAGSPTLLSLTAIVLAIWLIGRKVLLGHADPPRLSASAGEDLRLLVDYFRLLAPSSLLDPNRIGWRSAAVAIWSILIWSPVAMVLARAGALLVADRALMPFGPGLSLALRRTPWSWLVALVPVLCILPLLSIVFVLGWLASWSAEVRSLQMIAGLLAALLAVPCGLLAFGAHVAVPISWAALINEPAADPLDSLSRGYEYLLRRPVQLLAYGLLSMVLLTIIGSLASAVAWSAVASAELTLSAAGGSAEIQRVAREILWRLPVVVVLTLLWGLVGGVYLLLRQDAGNQEVEDLWEPPVAERTSLPELPK